MTVDLDDPAALAAADPAGALRAVATAAAQVREAVALSAESGLDTLRDDDRPRALVLCSTGGAGDVLTAVTGPGCPVPVVAHRTFSLPAWVGATDLVVAVDGPGRAPETLSALEEAVRRGCRLLAVGAAGSPLQDLAARGRGRFVPLPAGRPARASLWSLAVPLLLAADALRLSASGPAELAEAAQVLESVATRCRPDADTAGNPAKALALDLAGALPVVWGASPLSGAAAGRFAHRLGAAAGVPAAWGVLPGVGHDQLGVLDGPWAVPGEGDLFRDRADDPDRPGLHLVLLREPGELAPVARRADVCAGLAVQHGVPVSPLPAEGAGAPARLASLVALADFTAIYLALLQGTDPGRDEVREDYQDRTEQRERQ